MKTEPNPSPDNYLSHFAEDRMRKSETLTTLDGGTLTKAELRLWLSWIFVCVSAWIVGLFAGLVLDAVIGPIGRFEISYLLIGLLLSIGQALILRQKIHHPAWWSSISLSAFVIAEMSSTAVSAVITAALLGLGQWIVLRHEVESAGWCIFASLLSWVLGLILGGLIGGAVGAMIGGGSGLIIAATGYALLVGFMIGTINGGVLIWRLRYPTL